VNLGNSTLYGDEVNLICCSLSQTNLRARRLLIRDYKRRLTASVHLKLPEYIAYSHGITRGHDYKLTIPPTRIDAHKHSYFTATILLWNKLSNETVNASTFHTIILHLYSRARFCNYNNNKYLYSLIDKRLARK